jgi:hypothetical protein
VALGVLVQASFVAAYHYGTSGCFCAITTSAPAPPAFVTWAFEIGSMPLRQLLEGTVIQIGGLIPTLIFAALNTVFWTVGFFALLNLVALLCRLRLDRTTRRVRLYSLAAVTPGGMATGILLLVVAGLLFGAQYRRWWLASAKEAVHVAVGSVRAGEPFHKSGRYDISCYDACRPEDFAGPFLLKRYTGGHPLDRFVAPVKVAGTVEFARGSRYSMRVYHIDGIWNVTLGPAE